MKSQHAKKIRKDFVEADYKKLRKLSKHGGCKTFKNVDALLRELKKSSLKSAKSPKR